jgi:hypothetical protein
LRRHGTIALS